MAIDMEFKSRVRKLLEAIDASVGGDDEQMTLNQQRETFIAQGSSDYGESVRPGRAFFTGTITGVAAVVAIPTTAVLLALYNNDVDGGRSLIIDWVAAQATATTTTVAAQAQMLLNVGQTRAAVPATSALTIQKLNGLASGVNDTRARTIISGTALDAVTGVAANWFPWGANAVKTNVVANTTSIGYGCWAPVNGRFIIPPGRYFAMHVLADTVGDLFNVYVGWHEKQISLG